MSNNIIRTYALGNMDDVTTASATQNASYKLGDRMRIYNDGDKVAKEYIYVQSNGGASQYGAYAVTYSGTAGSEVQASAVATTSVYGLYGVAPIAVTTLYYFWLQIKGKCTALATSSTATATYFGKPANGVATITNESATRGTSSMIMWITTATGTSTVGYLLGERIIV
jgi:hypothetical protein